MFVVGNLENMGYCTILTGTLEILSNSIVVI